MSIEGLRKALPLLALAALAADAAAQCETQKLFGSVEDQRDRFGTAVALDGDTAMVGASSEALTGTLHGTLYVYERGPSGWAETQFLTSPTPQVADYFGCAVAIEGDLAVVGSYGDDEAAGAASGAVYVLERSGSTWSIVQKLTASNASFFSFFGLSVDVEGERIVVGAFGATFAGAETGAAYVFERSGPTWVETALLTASDGEHGDDFGYGVAIDGDRIVCTAPRRENEVVGDGAAYVFEHDGSSWVETTLLFPDYTGDSFLGFGWAVAMDGPIVAVGAPTWGGQGAAYVFEDLGSEWASKRLYPDPAPDDLFGRGVAVSGNRVLVGASGGDDTGIAYLFERGGSSWLETARIHASDGVFGDEYGFAVALHGDEALVGAPSDDDLGQEAGAVYVVEVAGQVQSYCATSPNTFGDGARMSWLGTTRIEQNGFRVVAQFAPPGQAGLFFYGPQQNQIPFGEGFLCVAPGGGVGTFRLQPPLVINDFGRVTRQVDFTTQPAGFGPGQIAAGSTWNFQFWYRDPAGGPAGFNLSDALSATFCP